MLRYFVRYSELCKILRVYYIFSLFVATAENDIERWMCLQYSVTENFSNTKDTLPLVMLSFKCTQTFSRTDEPLSLLSDT